VIRSLAPEQTQAGDDSPWLGQVEVPGQVGVQLPRVASSRAADGHCDGPPGTVPSWPTVIRGKDEIDLEVDPPPDLWIEVDHRGSSRGRMRLYAALGVPEIWRFRPRRQQPWFGSLQERTYVEVVRSLALPMLTPELVLEALNLGADLPESQWDSLLRNWIQGRLSPA